MDKINLDRFKWRIWNKEKKEYIDQMDCCYWDLCFWYEPYKEDKESALMDIGGKHIPEQCTGLKDTNGELIYEGDIVKCEKINPYSKFYDDYVNYYELEVKWGKTGFDNLNQNIYKYTIIGNIHEDKDLLEDK